MAPLLPGRARGSPPMTDVEELPPRMHAQPRPTGRQHVPADGVVSAVRVICVSPAGYADAGVRRATVRSRRAG